MRSTNLTGFDALWFRSRATHRKSETSTWSAACVWVTHFTHPSANFYGEEVKCAKFGLILASFSKRNDVSNILNPRWEHQMIGLFPPQIWCRSLPNSKNYTVQNCPPVKRAGKYFESPSMRSSLAPNVYHMFTLSWTWNLDSDILSTLSLTFKVRNLAQIFDPSWLYGALVSKRSNYLKYKRVRQRLAYLLLPNLT